MSELEIDKKCLNYNENLKFITFGKSFFFMPFVIYDIWDVTKCFLSKKILQRFVTEDNRRGRQSIAITKGDKSLQFISIRTL